MTAREAVLRGAGRGARVASRVVSRPSARRVARRLARTGVARRLRRPDISVVVPFYNVERYLADCLDSILAQDVAHLEVLLVDDGSPDGSRAVAEDYAARDPRVRLITRPNGGLGAARNTGVRHARGRHLTFVDSDDLLPPGALRVMLGAIDASGSDLVVGSVERFNGAGSWSPEWVRAVHGDRLTAVGIEGFPALLRNLYSWNKLFRREFWEAQDLWFREGVAYEDQPIITQLFVRARAIDVLPDVVYRYRARDDQSSISQQTASLADLRDRIEAWRVSRDALRLEASVDLFEAWRHTLFDVHFHWYLTSPGTVEDAYWEELVAAVRDLSDGAADWVWEQTMPGRRVLLTLALQDRRADAQELVRRKGLRLEEWPSTVRPDGVLLDLPLLGDPDLDDELFLLRPEQLPLHHSIENLHWVRHPDGRSAAWISGWAYLGKVDLAEHRSRVAVVLREDSTGTERVFWATERPVPSFPPPQDDTWCDHSPGAFGVEVPVSDVLADAADGAGWSVLLRVEAGGHTVTRPAQRLLRSGAAGVVPALALEAGGRVQAEWQYNRVLRLRVALDGLRVTAHLDARTLRGSLSEETTTQLSRVVATTRGQSVSVAVETGRPGRAQSFELELPETAPVPPGSAREWRVEGRDLNDRRVALVRDEGARELPAGVGAALETHRDGELVVREWHLAVLVDEASVDDTGTLTLRGRTLGVPVRELRLSARSLRSTTSGAPAAVADGRFEAVLDLRHEVYRFGRWPLPVGDHDVSAEVTCSDGSTEVVPVRTSTRLSDVLPVPVLTPRLEGRVVRGPNAGVRLSLVRPVGAARGAYQQHRLRTAPPRPAGLTPGVLMRSYFGESATDNGLSIQRELRRRGADLPVYWAVHDHSVVVPEGGRPVVVNSREWYELISSVQYYVDNMYQPEYHQKPEGQVVVQTFHGYPFKQMGHAHWENTQFSRARIESYDRRAAQWDHLVSPARYATPLLCRDFAYDGDVLEIGYPRNDVLLAPEAEAIRRATREALGIGEHQTAVLYAPTFRDYLATNDSRAVMADFFDFAEAYAALGDDFVILVRGHAFNARSDRRVGDRPGCIEVTDYPEVSDLYLAADAAIVDYSSLRFDFGVTGKPMIFHVPDLRRYQDTRGWLFDFEPTAPGPLVDTTAEVADRLLHLDEVRRQHAAAYAAFRRDYLDLEDGRAGERFVDAVFVPRGDAPPG